MTLAHLAPWMVLAAGMVMMAFGAYVLARAHYRNDSAINLEYALLDGTLNPPRVTLAKIIGFGAFLASSWWITWLVVNDKADSALITGYLLACMGAKVAGDMTSLSERRLTDETSNAEARRILEGR
jgi:hypothetical protein